LVNITKGDPIKKVDKCLIYSVLGLNTRSVGFCRVVFNIK